MDVESGPLAMELDTGLVYFRAPDETLESCGFVGDPDACPPGLERHWEWLLDAWRDSLGGGHEAEARRGYYERLDSAHWN